MSSHKVEVVRIDSIEPHPGADRLELARIADWQCVVRKGDYTAGQTVIYIPIDSILPIDLESFLFPPDSKVKLDKSRIKTIKLRGAISQGLIISVDEVILFLLNAAKGTKCVRRETFAVGENVAGLLGITKYEPPVKALPTQMQGNKAPKRLANPDFHKYTDIENFKHYPTLFQPGEMVSVTEKLHGTSARYALLPRHFNNVWERIWHKVLRMLDIRKSDYEFCFGSRHVQLQNKRGNWQGFYDTNVYAKIAKQYDIEKKLLPGEAVYGEIVGDGIQKNYTYGCGKGEHKFYVYDAQHDGNYISSGLVRSWDSAYRPDLNWVPELYIGPYDPDLVKSLAKGDSTIGGQKIREGVVIKPVIEDRSIIGRKVLKLLNDDYLLKDDTTDFH